MNAQIEKFATALEAAEACGASILERLATARSRRGAATLAVSGGSTPRIMFDWMAKRDFEWRGIDLFWVDERCVPMDDQQSNYRMTREALLDRISLPGDRVHRVRAELPPPEAAAKYAEDIARSFGLLPGQLPVFDVLQRGMGPDAHTASLFPGEPLIDDRESIAAAVWVPKLGQHRVTLLPGVLARAAFTCCLVTGADKSDALVKVLTGPSNPKAFPSQISSPEMRWYVDRLAAQALES